MTERNNKTKSFRYFAALDGCAVDILVPILLGADAHACCQTYCSSAFLECRSSRLGIGLAS
eukprot:5582736-Amphidinium_carterae.1